MLPIQSQVLAHIFRVAGLALCNQSHLQLFVRHKGIAASFTAPTEKKIEEHSGMNMSKEAMGFLHFINQRCVNADYGSYARLLQECSDMKALDEGKLVHAHMNRTGFKPNLFLENTLVNMYIKCKSLAHARQVFDKMAKRNAFSWNTMIAGYLNCGNVADARKLFDKMVIRNVFTWNTMIAGYANFDDIESARYLFDKMPERNLFSWNVMLGGYAKCGGMERACQLFDEMPERDVVSWTTMIAGYAQHGHADEALHLFERMLSVGMESNQFTFASILSACAIALALDLGKQIHVHILRTALESNVFVGSALVDFYTKCGSIDDAQKVFDNMPERNVISWTAMISGFAQNGQDAEALELFWQMQSAGMKPDQFTFSTALSACGNLAALERGKKVHAYLVRTRFESHICVGNTLVTMYAKCGSIDDAQQAFKKMPDRDGVSWTSMIVGYAQHGQGNKALQFYEQMLEAGMKPDHITFIGILHACSHSGLVDEGCHYFASMTKDYCITPRADHYGCMIDLFGRAGRLDKAEQFIDNMQFEPDSFVWGALLAACRMHGNMEIGERAAECLFELDPLNPASYVLLSNIYADAGRWDDVAKVRTMMKGRGLKKKPGCSWIEVKSMVHTFVVGDRSHPQTSEIYALLGKLVVQIKDAGYVPDMKFVLHDVEEEDKQHVLCHHSEKLAIAFGLINELPGKPIRLVKNLRVCGDCHIAIKFISKIVGREIIVRDANRFHHFKNGLCSCRDYW